MSCLRARRSGGSRESYGAFIFCICRLRLSGRAKPQAASLSCPQKLLDRSQDRLAVRNPARDDVVLRAEQLMNIFKELAAAVRTFHLAVAEQIQLRQQSFSQELNALVRV